MTFDLYQRFLDDEGALIEASLPGEWLEALDEAFLASPEGQALIATDDYWAWGRTVLEAAFEYEGVPPTQVTADVLEGIVFSWIPRKVSVAPEAAGEIIRELRAFFQWLGREHGHPHAGACGAALGEESEAELAGELASPKNFGMATSFLMGSQPAGLDMTRAEDPGGQTAPALSPDEKRARRKARNAQRKQRRKKKR